MTNAPKLITQSKAPSPVLIVEKKLWTGLYVLSGATGEKRSGLAGETRASVTSEKRIPKNKN